MQGLKASKLQHTLAGGMGSQSLSSHYIASILFRVVSIIGQGAFKEWP